MKKKKKKNLPLKPPPEEREEREERDLSLLPERPPISALLLDAPRARLADAPPEVLTAKQILLAAAPEAAVILREGILGGASKEQISASKAILAFQGIREDAAPARAPAELSAAAAGAAFGAVTALFKRFGIEPPSPALSAHDLPAKNDRRKKAAAAASSGEESFLEALGNA